MQVHVVDYSLPAAPLKLTESLRYTGFAVIKNHPLQASQLKKTYDVWKQFFTNSDALSRQKLIYKNFPRDEIVNAQPGFFPRSLAERAKGHSERDIKEYFQYYNWGPLPQICKEETEKTYDSLVCLASELLGWIEENLPDAIRASLSEPLPEMIKDSRSTQLRILHYPPLDQKQFSGTALRAAPHGDINLITVLPFSDQPGLQVKDIEGNWHDVPSDEGMIAVNTGDMLEMATGGYYPSTLHRVINPTPQKNISRLSMPLFLHPRHDVRLSAERTAGTFLKERLIELGVAA